MSLELNKLPKDFVRHESLNRKIPQHTMKSDTSLFEDFTEYTKKSSIKIKEITNTLNYLNNVRQFVIILMVLANTIQVVHELHTKTATELNDYKAIKETFGGFNNEHHFKNYPEFYDNFVSTLYRLSNIDSYFFQDIDTKRANIMLHIFHKNGDAWAKDNPWGSYDITGIKDGHFNETDFSKRFGLNFDISNSTDFKSALQQVDILTIKAEEIKFITYSDNNNFVCRSWQIEKRYVQFNTRLVMSKNDSKYSRCSRFSKHIQDGYLDYKQLQYKNHVQPNEEYSIGKIDHGLPNSITIQEDPEVEVYPLFYNLSHIALNTISTLANFTMLGLLIFMFTRIYKREYKFNSLQKLTKRFLKDRRTHFVENAERQIILDNGEIMFDGMLLFKDDSKQIQNTWWNVFFVTSTLSMLLANLTVFCTTFNINWLRNEAVKLQTFGFAFGVPLCWLNLLYIINFYPRLKLITKTLEFSMPQLMQILLEVSPIFFAFCFFALCMYSHTPRYCNITEVIISLLCVMAGDEIMPSLAIYVGEDHHLSGYIFGMVFVVFFFVIIQNLLVLIYSNGFETAMSAQEEEIKKLELVKKQTAQDTTMVKQSSFNQKLTLNITLKENRNISFLNEQTILKSEHSSSEDLNTYFGYKTPELSKACSPDGTARKLTETEKIKQSLNSKQFPLKRYASLQDRSVNLQFNPKTFARQQSSNIKGVHKTNTMSSEIESNAYNFPLQKHLPKIPEFSYSVIQKKEQAADIFKESIEKQIYPRSRVKVNNLWRLLKCFDDNQLEFENLIQDVIKDDKLQDIENNRHLYFFLEDAECIIDDLQHKFELITHKCQKYLKKQNENIEIHPTYRIQHQNTKLTI